MVLTLTSTIILGIISLAAGFAFGWIITTWATSLNKWKREAAIKKLEQETADVNQTLKEKVKYSESYNVLVENIISGKQDSDFSPGFPPYEPPPAPQHTNRVKEKMSLAWILSELICMGNKRKIDKRVKNIHNLDEENRHLNQKLNEDRTLREDALETYVEDSIVQLNVTIQALEKRLM